MKMSLFTLVFANSSVDEAIAQAAAVGYEAVEFMGRAPHIAPETSLEEARRIRGLLDRAGLKVSGIGSYTGGYSTITPEEAQKQLQLLAHYIDLAEILGTDLIRHNPGGPSPHLAGEAEWKKAVDGMKKAADLAGGRGIRLGMEIHHGGLVETAVEARRMAEAIGRENVGIIHDAGNMYIAHTEFGPESLEIIGEYLFHVHVKDEAKVADLSDPSSFKIGDDFYCHRLMGHGDVDHRPLLKALKAQGYQGYLSVECHGAMDKMEIARHELATIKEYLQEC